MLQLKLTQKVQKELGIKPKDMPEAIQSNTSLGDWFVNIFMLERRKVLIFVNEKTLLSFVAYGVKKENIKKLHVVFLKGLEQLLSLEEVEDKKINDVLDEYQDFDFTKTDNKKVLGSMNDLVNMYDHMIYVQGGIQSSDLTDVIKRINRTPQRNIGWSYSIEVVKEILC